MSQQGLDLRRSVQIVRRYKILVGAVTLLGIIAGTGYSMLNPPKLTGEALVALPSVGAKMATQVVVVTSDPVLSKAIPAIGGGITFEKLSTEVTATSLTGNVISIKAADTNGAGAVKIANAVAHSYISYATSDNPAGAVSAQLLQPAMTATGMNVAKQTVIYALLGLVAGALIGFIIALAVGRGDRRLRERDDIANSIGVPVLASVPADAPTDAPGWTQLLERYEPDVVHAWRLRGALKQLEADAFDDNGSGTWISVVSLASDRAALALGPQLASFAAAAGIPTILVAGEHQDVNALAALRTACATQLPPSSERARTLRLTASGEDKASLARAGAGLVVSVVVLDGDESKMPDVLPTRSVVLGVSAGAATAEQLARAATVAAGDKRDIVGILVANPEPEDRTSGRIPSLGRSTQRRVRPASRAYQRREQ